MKPGAAGCAEVFVEGVVDERVGEREAPGDACRLDQGRGGDRLLEQLQQLGVRSLHYAEKEIDVEVAPDHGRDRERLMCTLPEPVDPPAEHLVHALRKAELGEPAVDGPPPAVSLIERAGLDQVAQELARVEGVSVGLRIELLGQSKAGLVELVPGCALHDPDDVGFLEPLERDPLDPLFAV